MRKENKLFRAEVECLSSIQEVTGLMFSSAKTIRQKNVSNWKGPQFQNHPIWLLIVGCGFNIYPKQTFIRNKLFVFICSHDQEGFFFNNFNLS